MKMEFVTLSNGLKMPQIGLGMWDTYEEEAADAVCKALQLGYRHIDTAMFYKNEEAVGKGIRMSGVPREEITVVTKIWYTDMQPEKVRETFEKSLDNLGLDYVDLYLLHWPLNDYTGSWKVLEELYEEGKVKAIGVCNFQKHHMEKLLNAAKIKPMVNQIESHPLFSQDALVKYCQEQEIAVEVWGPLGQGNDLKDEVIVELSQKYQKTPAQIILRWQMQRGVIAIPKSVKEHRMIENASVFDFELSKEDMALINTRDTGITKRGYQPGYEW
jgi:diketogulonate reductase-like aldo/keto reductase